MPATRLEYTPVRTSPRARVTHAVTLRDPTRTACGRSFDRGVVTPGSGRVRFRGRLLPAPLTCTGCIDALFFPVRRSVGRPARATARA